MLCTERNAVCSLPRSRPQRGNVEGAFDKFSPWCQYLFATHFCVRSPCEEEMERGNSEKQ